MARFLIRRLLETIPLVLLLSFLVFTLFQLIPGDYLSEMEINPAVPREEVERLREEFGLNRHVVIQYAHWLREIGRGNLGYSFAQRRPAASLIWERLWGTVYITAASFLLTLLVVVPLSLAAAMKVGRWPDQIGLAISLIGLSLPTVLSSVLFLYLAFRTGWFPIGGTGSLQHLALPVVTLTIPTVAFFFRTLRLELIDVFQQPFVLAAVARGLPRNRVLWHALRNAVNPLISLSGITLGGLLSGAVVVEKVFNWPGIGALTVDSILNRDLFVALNCVLLAALVMICANLVSDILLAWNDPRVRVR